MSYPGPQGSYTQVTTTSWFTRLKGALVGILVGLVLIPGGAALLFWNEGRAVQTARSLAEGAGAVVAAAPDRVDPAMEGRLVHVTGQMRTTAPLADPEFGITAPDALRLVRRVEMYQWREDSRSETRERLGGGTETITTYTYRLDWAERPIASSRFRQPEGRSNPPFRYSAREAVAQDARLGAWRVAAEQLRGFGTLQPIALDPATASPPAGARILDGAFYLGADPARPQVGDMRIRFAAVPAEAGSVVARQAGDGFAPFQTRAGDALFMLRSGSMSAEEMIAAAEAANQLMTWLLRGLGIVLVFIGFSLLLKPLSVLASVVPLFGAVVGFGAMLVSGVLTFLLAPTVIAIAWFWYRPLVGALVLAGGIAVSFGFAALLRRRRAGLSPPAAPAAP